MFSVDFETFSSVIGGFGHLSKVSPLLSESESIHHLEKKLGLICMCNVMFERCYFRILLSCFSNLNSQIWAIMQIYRNPNCMKQQFDCFISFTTFVVMGLRWLSCFLIYYAVCLKRFRANQLGSLYDWILQNRPSVPWRQQ